ncbi:TlpA family protein disulfide reductase [Segeticoccus rhizosphaerae]|uniref:TlpA family protein disulfide reductase n=1 Tax=Segeticoccus rhizosphaerae TaxID=1104777 RepID=UPI0010C07F6C|nr:TlpA disulfide reductase family protein [Ornithinicoccus soli]
MTGRHVGPTRTTKTVLVGAILAVTVLLVGCGSDPNSISAQARAGDDKGYIAGDGTIEQIAADRRGSPLQIAGTTLAGQSWSLAKESGKVVVLNMWGSWCGPCVAEAPELQKAWRQFRAAKQPVQFMGLDFKEGPAAGRAFERKYGITYPSLAYDGGATQLALRGQAPTVPTTLVVDRQGRIAARILGQTTEPTLTRLVKTVLAER